MVEPIAMTQVRAEMASIRSTIDGGFQAVLAAASAQAGSTSSTTSGSLSSTQASQGPTASGSLTGLLLGASSSGGSGSVASIAYPNSNVTQSGPTGSEVVATAERYLGVPYVWGGASPSTGFDCSGLVQYVYGQLGVSLPRTSEQQASVGTSVPSLAAAKPGDLLIFNSPADGANGHVGIYIGGGKMIDAPYTGAVVRVDSVASAGVPTTIRQVLPAVSSDASSPYPTGGALANIFAQAGAQHNLPSGMLQAVATAESAMNPYAVSSAGAEGIMQLMPSTAASAGVNPFDPAQAIPAAAGILSGYLAHFGSIPLALAAYNAGPGAVTKYGGIPPYRQTQAYVTKVLSLMGGGA